MSAFVVFARMAQTLNDEARGHGWQTVGYRTAPRTGSRTIRHREDGTSTVAVSVATRRDQHVAWDMAYGLAVVNGLSGWRLALVAASLAQEAMAGSIRERVDSELRNARVIRYPEHV